MFRSIISAAQFKELNFKDVSYELATISPSWFHKDGTMRKSAKSELAKKYNQYRKLADVVLTKILQMFQNDVDDVTVVFDR